MLIKEGVGPCDGLAHAFGIEVKSEDIDVGRLSECQGVDARRTIFQVIARRRGRYAEKAFIADRYQMIRIHAFHVSGHILNPGLDGGGCAGTGGRQPLALAARLIRQLPDHDGGVVFVGQSVQRIHVIQNVADPILVPRADGGVRVELVVVLFLKPIDILIHAAVLGPIIYEGNDQFDSQLAGAVHGIIDVRQAGGGAIVVSRGTPVPVLQVKSVA